MINIDIIFYTKNSHSNRLDNGSIKLNPYFTETGTFKVWLYLSANSVQTAREKFKSRKICVCQMAQCKFRLRFAPITYEMSLKVF